MNTQNILLIQSVTLDQQNVLRIHWKTEKNAFSIKNRPKFASKTQISHKITKTWVLYLEIPWVVVPIPTVGTGQSLLWSWQHLRMDSQVLHSWLVYFDWATVQSHHLEFFPSEQEVSSSGGTKLLASGVFHLEGWSSFEHCKQKEDIQIGKSSTWSLNYYFLDVNIQEIKSRAFLVKRKLFSDIGKNWERINKIYHFSIISYTFPTFIVYKIMVNDPVIEIGSEENCKRDEIDGSISSLFQFSSEPITFQIRMWVKLEQRRTSLAHNPLSFLMTSALVGVTVSASLLSL